MSLTIALPEVLRHLQDMARARDGLLKVKPMAFIANRMDLHPRYPYRWADGSKPIPPEREGELLDALADLGFSAAHILDEVGDVLKKLAQTMEDGKVEPEEFYADKPEIRQAMVALWLLELALERKAGLR